MMIAILVFSLIVGPFEYYSVSRGCLLKRRHAYVPRENRVQDRNRVSILLPDRSDLFDCLNGFVNMIFCVHRPDAKTHCTMDLVGTQAFVHFGRTL